MEDQEWGEEHSPNIDVNSLDKITLIKGAGALQYSGNALGGVIVAETSNFQIKDSLYGKVLIKGESNGRGFTTTSNLINTNANGRSTLSNDFTNNSSLNFFVSCIIYFS